MKTLIRSLAVAITALALFQFALREAAAGPPTTPPEVLADWRSDAELTSVHFIDPQRGWTVGDHGVVLHTRDAGLHWTAQESGLDCRFRSVYFLTPEHGWIVGGYYDPYVHRSRGVLLSTIDGGTTWRLEPTPLLPALRKIRMRTAQEGWAVGDPSPLAPSGLHFTRDGGKTWSAAGGHIPYGITAADLVSETDGRRTRNFGFVADAAGRVAALNDRFLAATPTEDLDPQAVRDLKLRRDGTGWLVGDSGVVAPLDGDTWDLDLQPLGDEGWQVDWRAVALHDAHVWVVGSPGSVVLHSPDDGRNWHLLPTGQSLPLNDVMFVDPQHGYAVGALGTILATTDGGRTWQRQSYGDRRAALWSCFADAQSLPLEMIAKSCSDDGYRAVATLLCRRDFEPGTERSIASFDRTADALSAAGISAVDHAWSFPTRQAGLQPAGRDLLSWWGGGDAKLGLDSVQAKLVLQLRMWRPDVVLTHAPSPRGELPTDQALHELVLQAVELAGDPAAFPEQITKLGLAPWQAKKAFGYEPNQVQGTASVKTSDVLTRLAVPLDEFCASSRALLYDRRTPPQATMAVRMAMNRAAAAAPERDLFAGITLPAGGDARRGLGGINGDTIAKMRRAAERRRALEGFLIQKRGGVGGDFAARLRDVTTGLDDAAAGRAVFELAETFRLTGHWEAAREADEYLLTRWPQHPASEAALHRLTHYLASSEADHRLRRAMVHSGDEPATTAAQQATSNPASVRSPTTTLAQVAGESSLPQAETAAPSDRLDLLNITLAQGPPSITNSPVMPTPAARLLGRASEPLPASIPAPREIASEATASVAASVPTNPNVGLIGYVGDEERRKKCIALGAYFENRDPVGHADPSILFALAAARRKLGQTAEAESFYKHFVGSHAEDAWWECAAAEATAKSSGAASTKRRHRSLAAAERPHLDGKLDDTLWKSAKPLDLKSPMDDDVAWPASALIAHDEEYLYLAIRCKRTPDSAIPAPTGPRQRDADLTPHDRVDFLLDLDRDYTTYYKLSVDRRGWTAESCWDDKSWDPQWFVAAGGDETTWTAEIAIPWSELCGERPRSGDTWALGVQRVAPTIGFQSWTAPAGVRVRPEGFGHLTFE
jgi:photosystem II stability/assembly factor-like uncharacterized protein/LmbE family N-acetylglucosaminyl deacetylase